MVSRAFRVTLVMASVLSVAIASTRVSASAPQVAPAPQPSEADADAAGRALLEQACGVCHESNLVAGAFRMPEEWDDVISRMASYGATASDEQFAQVRAYLLHTYGKANVNTAAAKDLAPVLGVTSAVADAVVMYRVANGRFATLEDLKKVPGIDGARLDARKSHLTF